MISNIKLIKFALCIEYNGNNYHGWQKQKNIVSIQEKIELALSLVANHQVRVTCSGRTDAGVHSIGQVIHFETYAIRKEISWLLGVNSYLPNDIVILWIKQVPMYFHARYCAFSRVYRYLIYNRSFRSAIFINSMHYIFHNLDIEKMHLGGQYLLGEHDFSAFRSTGCQSSTAFRNIRKLNVMKNNFLVIIDIEANSFLYHMVRNIVGTLIEIGLKKKKKSWMKKLLKSKNRHLCGPTVQARGLYLLQVKYPSYFDLPS
ncbi:tRNA pseudouridine synthase A [Buchnera aphidicola (Eriosoma grossulariae)]|uniref:tRNA pseudouridine(38-40) synthase TruA n=1 Tax=Buchnera aphidicola TaxID=9 RepID=UPI003463F814